MHYYYHRNYYYYCYCYIRSEIEAPCFDVEKMKHLLTLTYLEKELAVPAVSIKFFERHFSWPRPYKKQSRAQGHIFLIYSETNFSDFS